MAYLAVDFAIKTMSRKRWRFCKAPSLLRRWETQISASVAIQIAAENVLQNYPEVIKGEGKERLNWFK